MRALRYVTLLLFVTGALACGRLAPRQELRTFEWPSPAADVGVAVLEDSAPAGTRFDRFGNLIDAAVEDYRVDEGGDLYEEHSPETEVATLGAPGA